jgi:hypothetical protein
VPDDAAPVPVRALRVEQLGVGQGRGELVDLRPRPDPVVVVPPTGVLGAADDQDRAPGEREEQEPGASADEDRDQPDRRETEEGRGHARVDPLVHGVGPAVRRWMPPHSRPVSDDLARR